MDIVLHKIWNNSSEPCELPLPANADTCVTDKSVNLNFIMIIYFTVTSGKSREGPIILKK